MDVLPQTVRIGMPVYDSERKHIGKVDDLKFPENATDPDVVAAGIDGTDEPRETVLAAIADAFGYEDVPEPLRSRLLTEGYLHLDADGLFAADRYILPSQINSIAGDEVHLNVKKDALIKKP